MGYRNRDVIVIGAGQAGLAMSRCLSARGIDHAVLDRGDVAGRWRGERWDSLRLLTPNWMTRLPGHAYDGPDPQGFMTRDEVAGFLAAYGTRIGAPVETHCPVHALRQGAQGFELMTGGGQWRARAVVIATGACDTPMVPGFGPRIDPAIAQITSARYRRPADLAPGGVLVVGASATGAQLAEEIHRSGRPVTLATGTHMPVPRRYRGRDIMDWLDACGLLAELRDPAIPQARALRQPSFQLVGTPEPRDISLATLAAEGVRIVGRVRDADGARLALDPDPGAVIRAATARRARLLDGIDAHIAARGLCASAAVRATAPVLPGTGPAALDLRAEGIRTILWATGYRRRYPWLKLPVLSTAGEIIQSGGLTPLAGLYTLGLPFMRRRNSTFIDGVGDDARHIATVLSAHLGLGRAEAAA